LKVPDDLAIVSFDNHPISEALQITTMDLPLSLMGKKAFRMVYRCLETGKTKSKAEKLAARLIERSSV
jgi:LacI family repressor for deo operon, udp, cdd, tsx, nupC, and nupG